MRLIRPTYCPVMASLALSLALSSILNGQAVPVTNVLPAELYPVIQEQWTTANGLPQNSVNDILQTRDGYIWIATFGGLARFDGVEFTVLDMAHPSGPPTNRALSLYESNDGSLWVGGQFNSLSRYRDGGWKSYAFEAGAVRVQTDVIAEDDNGTIWLGTPRGPGCVEGDSVVLLNEGDGWLYGGVPDLAVNSAGVVWLATVNGLVRYDAGAFEPVDLDPASPPTLIGGLHVDRRDRLWIVDIQGRIWLMDGDEVNLIRRVGGWGSRLGITEDADGNVILGGGINLIVIDPDALAVSVGAYDMTNWADVTYPYSVRTVLSDREGNLWIGKTGAGLTKVRESPFGRHTAFSGERRGEVWAVTGDGAGGLWVGDDVRGLIHYVDGETARLVEPGGQLITAVRAVIRTRSGALWASDLDQLFVIGRADTNAYAHDGILGRPGGVPAMLEDDGGNVWLSSGGLYRYDDGEFLEAVPVEEVGLGGTECLFQDSAGALWLGRTNGLYRYTPDSLSQIPGVPGTVRTIHEDDTGTLWVGTYGAGLFRLAEGVLTHYTTADGLYDNFVSRILEDEYGNLWMNGNMGLSFVSRSELNAFARGEVRRVAAVGYGPEDGVAEGNGGGGWQTEDGTMWFPTIDGLVEVDPVTVRRNDLPPPVRVEHVMLGGYPVEYAEDGVRVPPGGRDVEIKYTALSFVRPRHVKFRYQIVGYDDDWVDAGTRRTAYYTGVPPGEYRFRVIASNGDGVWNDEGATVAMTVLPHFYQRLWFKALAGLLTAAVLYGYYHLRMRRVQERLKEIQRFNVQLQETESRFRGASEGSLDAFFLLDGVRDESDDIVDFEIVDLNERGTELVGLSREKVIGRRLTELLTASEESGNLAKYVDVVRTGIPFEEVRAPVSPILKAEWIRQQVVKVGDGLAVTARDITLDRQEAEERERLQAQLLQAQKLESVGLLAGGVAHDFNNVLTLVMGHAEFAETMISETDPAHASLKEVVAAGVQGGHLTRQLLALSRRQPSAPQFVDPNARILAFDHMLRRVIGSNYELTTLPGEGVGAVRIDPGHLEQVLLNLVVNARDAMPNGGAITIATQDIELEDGSADIPAGLTAGRYVALTIEDTGEGMDAETRKSIFDPFFTTKCAGKGTGLGLATCTTIVDDAGGAIAVESEPGVGSTFSVYLPVVSDEAADSEGVAESREADLRGTETILLLDDNSSVRAVMASGLIRLGYQVLPASIPSEAVTLFEGNRDIRLLVSDIVLPHESGVNVARQLQRRRPDLKVLLVSGYTSSEQVDSMVALQYPFLQKPFVVSTLARKVREVLDR